jgi:septum site-determining protein MinC
MREQTVVIKGVKDGLQVTLDAQEEWSIVATDLAGRIDQQSSFFTGARIIVDVGARPVRRDEMTSLKALLERRGLTLYCIISESQTSIDSAVALDLRAVSTVTNAANEDGIAPINSQEDGTSGVMIKRTLRSGRTVHSQGHVVIYGDVNAGAEIVAAGDVIVWGRLRGNVHAGANGDEEAIVCALDMTPTQLRIAGYITTSPADKRHKPRPEMALIRDGHIVVEAWQ